MIAGRTDLQGQGPFAWVDGEHQEGQRLLVDVGSNPVAYVALVNGWNWVAHWAMSGELIGDGYANQAAAIEAVDQAVQRP